MLTISDAAVSFVVHQLVQPLRLSSGIIDAVTQATANVVLEVEGRQAEGRGAIFLSHQWAWPDSSLPADQRDSAMRQLCHRIALELPQLSGAERLHPLEHGFRVHEFASRLTGVPGDPPPLARGLCASPFDAAIHDAAGIALSRSSFELFANHTRIPSADRYFAANDACAAVAATIQPPRKSFPAWYVVSHGDDLDRTLVPAIRAHQYRCFKLKLSGRDNALDVAETVNLYRSLVSAGVSSPSLTVDSNEGNPSAESVLEYLDLLRAVDARTYEALQYLEQPTSRDIGRHPFDWQLVVGSSRVDLQACKLEYSIVSPK